MEGELNEADQPDGQLFRKNGVEVTLGGIKVIHRGVEPESKIIEGLSSMLHLIADNDMPRLISAIASHYLFETVHPFYDGNGRTGRYLLALSLKDVLSDLTALSLSRAIAENKNLYYSAFATVQNPLNHGEMTHFVYSMFELVRIAQSTTMQRIQESIENFSVAKEKRNELNEEAELSKSEIDLLFILAQYDLFGPIRSLTLNDFSREINLGKQMIRKHLLSLEEKGFVQTCEKRPLRFPLTQHAESRLGIERAGEMPFA